MSRTTMVRMFLSPAHVTQVAREFACSRLADSWNMFGSDIRRAIVDSWVMTQIQWAHVADSAKAFTATVIIEFRDLVIAKLAEGVVPAHTRGMKRSFHID